jgi:hypothetical protein
VTGIRRLPLTTRTYGILAGVIGSALGAWLLMRRRNLAAGTARDRGTVVFDNTPMAVDFTEGVI